MKARRDAEGKRYKEKDFKFGGEQKLRRSTTGS